VRWPGQTSGAIGLALIFLVLFASRQKEHKSYFSFAVIEGQKEHKSYFGLTAVLKLPAPSFSPGIIQLQL